MAQYISLPVYFLLTLTLWLYIRKKRPERAQALIAVYIMGIVLTIPAMVFELAVNSYASGISADVPVILYAGFVSTGLVEELLCFFALYAEVKHARLLHSRFDVALVGLFIGAGLALGQTLLQALLPGQSSALRAFVCLPVGLICGTLMGWWYGRTKVYSVPVVFNNTCAIVCPVLLHGALETGMLLTEGGYRFGYYVLFALLIPSFGLFLYYLLSKLSVYGQENR